MGAIEFCHLFPFVRKMISDIICVFLLLCRIYFSISVDDDIAKGFLPQNFAVYIGNALALRYGNIMFALP